VISKVGGIIQRIPVIVKCELANAEITARRMGVLGRIKFDVPPEGEHE